MLCLGCSRSELDRIVKAKGRRSAKYQATGRAIQAIAVGMERQVMASLVGGIARFRRRISSDSVAEALVSGRIEDVTRVIPWEKLPEDLSGLEEGQTQAFLSASKRTIKLLPPMARELIIGTSNPNLKAFIDGNVGKLIREISEDTRRTVAQAMSQALDSAWTPRRAAELVKQSVGLTAEQSQNVQRQQWKLLSQRQDLTNRLSQLELNGQGNSITARSLKTKLADLTDARIENRMLAVTEGLNEHRALTIARTELTRSVNAGQVEVWNEAANQGLVDRGRVRRVWVAVNDEATSPICEELDGQSVGMDESFVSEETGETFDAPPAHPNCRSAVVLRFD